MKLTKLFPRLGFLTYSLLGLMLCVPTMTIAATFSGFDGQSSSQTPTNNTTPSSSPIETSKVASNNGVGHSYPATSNSTWAQMRFVQTIDDPETSVSQIHVTWNGYGKQEQSVGANSIDGAALYIWNYNSGSYESLGASADTESEVTINGQKTTSLTDYIGGTSDNTITVLAVTRSKRTGNKDLELFTDYINVSATISTSTADHYNIQHSGNAVTCAVETVTLTAHQADHSIDISYLNTVNLTTSTAHGDWSIISANGTLNNGTINDGAASYTFIAEDNGSVQLGLKNTTIETLNINTSDGSISETSGSALASEDPNLTFNETGFRFLANTTASAIGTQISAKDSDTAPGNQTLELQAIRTSSTTGACEAVLVNNNSIELAYECLNPTTCSANRVVINGINIGANGSNSISNYVPVSLNFGNASDSTATFKLNYSDAGQIRLHARYNTLLGNGNPSGNFLTGNSNNFVVKPAGLCVEATETNSDCLAGNVSCNPPFKKAGEIFNLRITAVGWQSSGESHSDFCSGNSTTSNFQLNNIALFSNLVAPSPGTNANLGVTSFNMTAANSGAYNIANQSVSEVGVFTLSATPPSYLGETIDASNSANIGRFYPDRFEVNTASITEACSTGSFSYLGQDFTALYTLTAKNTGTGTTANYRGNFIRLDPSISPPVAAPLNTLSFGAIDNSAPLTPVLLSTRLSESSTSFTWNNDGTGILTSTLSLARLGMGSSNVDGPFTAQIGVLPTDADGVTVQLSDRDLNSDNTDPNDHVLIGSSIQHYGRLVIDNAFGPEVLGLKIPLRAEYWNSTAFVINSNDTACSGSLFTTPNFIFTDPLPAPTDSLEEADLSSKSYSPITSGSGSLTLGAPNASGPLNISLTVPDWLKFDFDGNTSDENPSAQAFFGQYRGNDRIIYWREQFQ